MEEVKEMSNTAKTIKSLQKFQTDVRVKMATREVVTFELGDIEISADRMRLNGDELSDDATKKVLGHLRVKNNFLDLSKKLSPGDWAVIKEKIKAPSITQTVHGRKVTSGKNSTIDDIYIAAPKNTGIVEIDTIFNEVIDAIVGTGKDITIKETRFLDKKDEVHVTLIENDNEIDIFGTGKDMWKIGKHIAWNGMNFSISPFFERLSCSNGNTANQYGFKANISNKKFNIEKIKNVLLNEITVSSDSMEDYLIDATNHLKSSNVSVKEYLKYRNFFNEEEHPLTLKKWFNDSFLSHAYGISVDEMSPQWQSTADTNINAYDFFNDLTYIASHESDPDVTLTPEQMIDLQIKASDLLFQKVFDLEQVAKKVDWVKITKKLSELEVELGTDK